MLALFWACHDTAFYIKGCPQVEVHTDHLPLIEIFKKYLHELSDQCLKVRLQMTDYTLGVQHIVSHSNEWSNCLSRMPHMKSWNYYYPMEDKYTIKNAQSMMKVDQYNNLDDPALNYMFNHAKED